MPLTSSVMRQCVSNFRLYCCSKKFQMLRKNVKSLLGQLQVCIFVEIVFGVRCTLNTFDPLKQRAKESQIIRMFLLLVSKVKFKTFKMIKILSTIKPPAKNITSRKSLNKINSSTYKRVTEMNCNYCVQNENQLPKTYSDHSGQKQSTLNSIAFG